MNFKNRNLRNHGMCRFSIWLSKEPFIEEQTECFVKGNRCIHVSQQATTLTFVVNDLRLVMEKQCRNHEEVFQEVNHILLNIFEETPCVFSKSRKEGLR